MPITDDYADEYTGRERARFLVIGLAIYGALFLLWKYGAQPRWSAFASSAHCHELWGVGGDSLLFYALFVGLPLLSALALAIVFSRRGVRVLRDGQIPYRGEKVFRRTRIKRGRVAMLAGWAQLLAPLGFLAIALWGAPTARDLINKISSTPASCETRPATLR